MVIGDTISKNTIHDLALLTPIAEVQILKPEASKRNVVFDKVVIEVKH
jgi:hypothetical protein